MYGVKVRCVGITYIKEHQPQWVGAAAVVTRHFHVRRHHHRLTLFHRDWLAPLHFQRERAFQDIDSHRETVCMEQGFIARFKRRRENAHLLALALGHSLNDLAQEQLGFYDALFLRHRHELTSKTANARHKLLDLFICISFLTR
jgi:hypothetical protein